MLELGKEIDAVYEGAPKECPVCYEEFTDLRLWKRSKCHHALCPARWEGAQNREKCPTCMAPGWRDVDVPNYGPLGGLENKTSECVEVLRLLVKNHHEAEATKIKIATDRLVSPGDSPQ